MQGLGKRMRLMDGKELNTRSFPYRLRQFQNLRSRACLRNPGGSLQVYACQVLVWLKPFPRFCPPDRSAEAGMWAS